MHLKNSRPVLLIGAGKKHNHLTSHSVATLTLGLGLYCATLFDYAIHYLRDTNDYRELKVPDNRLFRK